MPSVIENKKIKEKCQVFTPVQVVSEMLDMAGYNENLFGKRVLENSCGNGEVLVQIVQRYIDDCKKKRFSKTKIKFGLETDIVAYEIDDDRIKECINRLNIIAKGNKLEDVKWNINNLDFIKTQIGDNYNYIIGNPPYIAYPDLPQSEQTYLKNNFMTCKKGKFDYSYAFIEKSYNCLSDGGVLVYIIPSNIFKNVFANNLRELIKNDLQIIVDFPDTQVFDKVLVSPAIIKVKKNSNENFVVYSNGTSKTKIPKKSLENKWVFFQTNEKKGKKIGDYYKVSSTIATLLNDAFVLKNAEYDDMYYYTSDHKIERELIRKAISPKNKKYKKTEEYIIFPYYYDNNDKLCRYKPEEFEEQFPNATKYLTVFEEKLKKRDSDKAANWYEYGRSQALQHMKQRKILISSVISDCTEAYLLESDEIPYSGLYIVQTGKKKLEDLLPILNSLEFKEYIMSVGVCVSGTSKRITPSDIANYVCDF